MQAWNGFGKGTGQNDLQYACIFELPSPRNCEQWTAEVGCDCENDPDPTTLKRPVCQQPDNSYSTVQRYAKAYPGTRFLQVAKDIGEQAVVASICPKSLDPGTTAYGYTAVAGAP